MGVACHNCISCEFRGFLYLVWYRNTILYQNGDESSKIVNIGIGYIIVDAYSLDCFFKMPVVRCNRDLQGIP